MKNLRRMLSLMALLGILWIPGASVLAVEKLRVVALFNDKAMVEIDGKRRLLRAGSRSPEGVLLISADTDQAVLEFDGHRESYGLGSVAGGSFAKRELAQVQITKDARGAFMTTGTINGRMVDMMVDTGATAVAMSEPEAKRLGIRYRVEGQQIGVNTAAGRVRGYKLKLDRVRVGEIELSEVDAIVVQGDSPHQVLLGMSFLGRLKMENVGNLLLLKAPY